MIRYRNVHLSKYPSTVPTTAVRIVQTTVGHGVTMAEKHLYLADICALNTSKAPSNLQNTDETYGAYHIELPNA